jgi:hypothetical protein
MAGARRFRCWLAVALAVAIAAGLSACGRNAAPTPAPTETASESGPPLFREVAAECGIRATYVNGEEAGHLAILESLGGGVALLDYNGDGRLDVFITGGGSFEGPDRKQIVGRGCKLFQNEGGWKFRDVTREAGLDGPWFYTHGCAVGDFDRDGWPDLLITGWGRVALLHNEPVDARDPARGRRFVDVTAKAGLDFHCWSTSAGWADFDGDGYPDLYICQYVDWSFANHPTDCFYDGKTRDVCSPKTFAGLPHKLFRNNGDGTFTDISPEAGLRPAGKTASKGLGVVLVDVNGDGKPDIFVANDTVDNFLYINQSRKGEIRFEERGLFSGVARDSRGSPNGSMGADAADYDGSGSPALWVTNYENELHGLYKNRCTSGKMFFSYETRASGIAAIGQRNVAWGTGFLDIDHHGWEDILIANGHAIHFPTGHGITRRQRPILLRNEKGHFQDISSRGGAYFEAEHLGRGVALGDLDNDGRIDAVISHLNEPVAVLRNEADTGGRHWLGVELVGRDHADVVGAKVVLDDGRRCQTRWAKGGGSYASSGDRRLVFGLPDGAKSFRVTVTWPDGTTQDWSDLALDRYHRLTESAEGR